MFWSPIFFKIALLQCDKELRKWVKQENSNDLHSLMCLWGSFNWLWIIMFRSSILYDGMHKETKTSEAAWRRAATKSGVWCSLVTTYFNSSWIHTPTSQQPKTCLFRVSTLFSCSRYPSQTFRIPDDVSFPCEECCHRTHDFISQRSCFIIRRLGGRQSAMESRYK